jgi:hypothetical protein
LEGVGRKGVSQTDLVSKCGRPRERGKKGLLPGLGVLCSTNIFPESHRTSSPY